MNALFLHLMSAPTVAGRRIMDAIEGFRMYLSDAQQSPAMAPQMVEKYLPYALALDVENAWGERFTAALGVATPGPETFHPAWYSRQSGPQRQRLLFRRDGRGLASAVSASANAPGSTEGGGGSGGGGSAGGGGGGGGGGGW